MICAWIVNNRRPRKFFWNVTYAHARKERYRVAFTSFDRRTSDRWVENRRMVSYFWSNDINQQSNRLLPSFNRAYNLFVYFWSIDQSSPNANAALRFSRGDQSAEYRCARVFSPRPLPASMWIEIAFQPNRGEPTLSHSIRCRVSRRPSGPLPAPFIPLGTYLLAHGTVKSEISRQFAFRDSLWIR